MVYRIRYSDGRSPHGAEAVVEAATPTEALVKFCHTLDDPRDPAKQSPASAPRPAKRPFMPNRRHSALARSAWLPSV